MRAKPKAILIGLTVVLWVSAVGVGGYAVFSKLSEDGSLLGNEPAASSTPTPTPTPTRTRPAASPVLGAVGATSATAPTQAGLAAALSGPLSADSLGSHVGVAVRDVATGKLLYGRGPDETYTPASTTKVVTVAAALQAYGPRHRFSTTVVQGTQPGSIVLVGGGDPLLATAKAWSRRGQTDADGRFPVRATIDDLAARAAKELTAGGLTEASVTFDDTLFEEAVSPAWEANGYIGSGEVSRVMALWVDEGRLDWPENRPRATDPALTAAKAFVTALEKNGITVTGDPERGPAPANAKPVASVESPTLADIAEHVLLTSDDDGAEVLAHQVAVARKQPVTFAGAALATAETLRELGVTVDQLELNDGSGLARSNRFTPAMLTQILTLAASPDHPKLRPLLTGLPVAAFNGTLDERFGTDSAQPGIGVVRAKTGTLSGISTLAGVVTTKDGQLLAFAVMADQRDGFAEPALDRVAATLATCGCG